MAFNIGAIISVSGEREYNQAINSIRQNLKYVTSEMKLATSEFKNNEKSVDSLTRQNEILEKVLAEQEGAVTETRAALERLKSNGVDPASKAYKSLEANLNYAKAAVFDTTNEIKTNSEALNKAKEGTEELSDKQAEGQKSAKKYLGGFADIADMFGIKLPAELKGSIGKFDDLGTAADGAKATTGTAVEGMLGSIDMIGPAAGIAAGAIIAIGKAAIEAQLEVEKLEIKMQIALGLTAEEAEKAKGGIERIYMTGLTENREAAEQALAAVMNLMGTTGTEAEKQAAQIAMINKVWGEDFATTARTASTLMQTFGITGQEALDIIVRGLQTSANKNGDLLDVLNEYSPSFKRMGDDADTFLSRIVAATDAGAYSADKAADAYKEFFNKAAGNDASYLEGLEDLKLNSTQITNMILSGGDSARRAMEIVINRIDGVKNEAEKARIASKLFGSQWEDVGTPAVLAMGEVKGAIVNTMNAASIAMDKFLSDTSTKLESFKRQLWKGVNTGLVYAVRDAVGNFLSGNQIIPHYATGTLFHPGGPALVGDGGPEILDLPRGTRVRNNNDTMRMLAAGGGGDTFYVTIDAKNVREFNDIVKMAQSARQTRRAGGR